MKLLLKSVAEKIPYPIGKILSKVPFELRLGKDYTSFSELIHSENSPEQKMQYTINHFSKIFTYAKENFPFYKNLYSKYGVYDLQITSLDDIKKLPVITKEMIRGHFSEFSGAMKLNTGGTSGKPFSFYVDKNAFAREWAHMHKIWEFKDYNFSKLKVTLRGKNLGDVFISYNPVHNEFIVNTYKEISEYKKSLITLFKKRKIEYLHGYPSAVYNFLKEAERILSDGEKAIISKHIKACFLGSEFPMPYMVDYITKEWGLDYISWYGHSEMCILGYDLDKKNSYNPFFSYGMTEVEDNYLIGTSFHNFDMPLIRYNTGDLVVGTFDDNGLVDTFSIKEGRNGDFVEDCNGKKIPLTALIFGRHHTVFEIVDYVQVKQIKAGYATIVVTTKNSITKETIIENMDLSNVCIEFSYEIIEEPVRTKSGKLPLLIT